MNNIFYCLIFCALLFSVSCQQSDKQTANSGNGAAVPAAPNVPTASGHIDANSPVEWITVEQLESKMKEQPRKVVVDLYTDWCGWCKRMDKSTFGNVELAKYLNEKFYAVKFNAETPNPITFKGETFSAIQNGRRATNQLTHRLILGDQTNGRIGYPTFAFLDEQLNRIEAYPGFKDANGFDALAHFIAENHYKTMKFEQFQTTYQSPIPAEQPMMQRQNTPSGVKVIKKPS